MASNRLQQQRLKEANAKFKEAEKLLLSPLYSQLPSHWGGLCVNVCLCLCLSAMCAPVLLSSRSFYIPFDSSLLPDAYYSAGTTLFRWSPDWEGAALSYEAAGTSYSYDF